MMLYFEHIYIFPLLCVCVHVFIVSVLCVSALTLIMHPDVLCRCVCVYVCVNTWLMMSSALRVTVFESETIKYF